MAFRALLFSTNSETNAAVAAACKNAGIHPEVCSDIFTAIEKGKTRAFSCVIADWSDQPEASFLLRRARESAPNRDTVAIAVVDREPTPAETRDNRLDFLISRPIAFDEASVVLTTACEKMQPLGAEDSAELPEDHAAVSQESSAVSAGAEAGHKQHDPPTSFSEANAAQDSSGGEPAPGNESDEVEEEPRPHGLTIGFPGAIAAMLVLAAAFCLWRSREVIQYLSQTPEGKFQVLRESVEAFFHGDRSGSAGPGGQPDAYYSRDPAGADAQIPALRVAATASTLAESRIPLRKAADFPLPAPVLEHREVPPIHTERAAIPDSMKNSPPIAPPVVVAVTPAQMMPVSVPQPQPAIQQVNEPVAVTEDAARALLVHTVNPVYPPEALAQKLHGPVVLQAVIGRDGGVEDLKIVRGYFVLGKAAIAAVKQWRFQPYSINGHAASTQTVITINFSYPPG